MKRMNVKTGWHPHDYYDPVARIWLPWGLFPGWDRWQDFRCWRDVVAYPAIRRSLRPR